MLTALLPPIFNNLNCPTLDALVLMYQFVFKYAFKNLENNLLSTCRVDLFCFFSYKYNTS